MFAYGFGAVVLAATAAVALAAPGAAPRCKSVKRPAPKRDGGRHASSLRLDPRKHYDVTLETTCGSFTIRLDVRHSPRTAASFVYLARTHFFERTIFHRIVPGFVIQGGDPTQTGAGGPGYQTVDRPPQSAQYTKYTVAMAKTQTEPAGTSGSQFFVVTGDNVGLPPDYALLGKVYVGRRVVDLIGRLGDPNTQQPTRIVEIDRTAVAISPAKR